jgi:hypothetical protein
VSWPAVRWFDARVQGTLRKVCFAIGRDVVGQRACCIVMLAPEEVPRLRPKDSGGKLPAGRVGQVQLTVFREEIEINEGDNSRPSQTELQPATRHHRDHVATGRVGRRRASGSRKRRWQQCQLNADPYNEAARRGMTRSEELRTGYFGAARNQMRAGLLSATSQLWEEPVQSVDVSHLFGSGGSATEMKGGAKEGVLLKLRSLAVPLVDLDAAGLSEVVEFLRIRSRELDPARKGIDFVLRVEPEFLTKPVSLRLASVPVKEVLRHATEMAGAVCRVDERAVIITSRADNRAGLISRQYRVPPALLQTSPVAGGGNGSQCCIADDALRASALGRIPAQ